MTKNKKSSITISSLCVTVSDITRAASISTQLPIIDIKLGVLTSLLNTFPAINGYFQGIDADALLNEISKIIEYCFFKKLIIDGDNSAIFSGTEIDIDSIETLLNLYPDLMTTVLQLIGG